MFKKKHYIQSLPVLTAMLASLALVGCESDSSDNDDAENGATLPELSEEAVRPIVFVHGGAGSAAQYMSQAMRFASNGYPENYIFAFEYHGVAPHNPAELDAFIDDVLAETGEEQVYLVTHSMGTYAGYEGPLLSGANYTGYLWVPEYAAKVAKFIGLDGLEAAECPGGVPCIGIFDEDDGRVLGENTFYLADQEHVETATSAESFAIQFTFLTGEEPTYTHIVPEDGPVDISGRAVIFPNNTGTDGATLEVWPVDPDTGFRSGDTPMETYSIGADGSWGPTELDPDSHYEFTLIRTDHSNLHFYLQPLPRDTDLVRLNASATGSEILANTNTGEDHSTLVVTRQREWIADAPDGERDELWISTVSPQWGNQAEVNAIVEGVTNGNIALHIHDDESTPAHSSLELLNYFPDQAFQSGVDVYMPASDYPADDNPGTITLRSVPHGNDGAEQILNVPNWPSASDRISVQFNDWW
ncbi:alpha/beta fold hydrolase [Marinobacter lacisalsi]|uniref:Alpha/beta fold hydrolase n=1 Tax=Marinobacter lacisalsi TaxID=475979 RepID=A0ABV8QJ28_9GAMM